MVTYSYEQSWALVKHQREKRKKMIIKMNMY